MMTSNKRVVCIVSKPLQFMVAELITSTELKRCFVLIDMFFDAQKIATNIKKEGYKVKFVRNRFQSFLRAASLRPTHLYIDGDIGTRLHIYLMLFRMICPKTRIYVYEEGIGTYRDDIYDRRQLRRATLDKFRISTYFGGSPWVEGVCVFEPERYRNSVQSKKDIYLISPSLDTYIKRNLKKLCRIFEFQPVILSDKPVASIYLSSWTVSLPMLEKLAKRQDEFTIVKFHPHAKSLPNVKLQFSMIVKNNIPAELLVLAAARHFEKVIIWHHGTSVENYIKSANIIWRKLDDNE